MIKAASEGFVNPSLHKDEEEALSSAGSFHREKNNPPLAGAIDPSRADRLDAEAVGRGPVWAVIEQVIAGDIAAGMYKPGEKLPSENALALRFGVNRHTVRQATSHLARRGVVRIEHGRGIYVLDSAIDYVLGRRTRFSRNLAAVGLQAKHRLIEVKDVAAGPKLAEVFQIGSDDIVTLIVARGEAGNRVLSVGEHYFPPCFSGIAKAIEDSGSISQGLSEFGISDYERRRSVITARLPDARTALRLGQAESRPVICVEYVNVSSQGQPVEFGRTCFHGDQMQLTVEHDFHD